MLEQALKHADAGRSRAEADFFEELRIPSVSAASQHRSDVRRNAEWLADRLRRIGFRTEIIDVAGGIHPVVHGDLVVNPRLSTLTIYGHYDVQPVDPLDEWVSPPFIPTIRDGMVYARGAADNKGNHLAALKAVEYSRMAGGPPLNVRFLIEGEEEVAGESLGRYARENAGRLKTDYLLLWDGGFTVDGEPSLVTGLRGVLHVEIETLGAAIDLHSGLFGGVAPNPLNTLGRVLGALKDEEGRVTIPGFYDAVRNPTQAELKAWEPSQQYAEVLMQTMRVRALEGEPAYPPIQRQWTRPTLDVHGIIGGFTGEGVKTVIPSRAIAKLSMRLVPDQDPDVIWRSLRKYVGKLSTPGVTIRVKKLAATPPMLCDADHDAAAAATAAFEKVFGMRPRLVRSGGSIPVALDLKEVLHARMVISGIAQSDSRVHSPNEHLSLDQFHRGTQMLLHFIYGLPSRTV